MIGHGEFNDDAVRAATRDDDVRVEPLAPARGAGARSQRATVAEDRRAWRRGAPGSGTRRWSGQSPPGDRLPRLPWCPRDVRLAPTKASVAALERVARAAENLDGSVEPAASARVLNSARRQLSFTPRVAAPRRHDRMRKRERECACFICGHYHRYEDGEICAVCGYAGVPASFGPPRRGRRSPSDRRSVSPPLFCRSHQPPRPEAHPFRAHSRARSSHNSSTSVATTTAQGRRCFGRTSITHMLNCVPTCRVLHRTQFTTYRERGRRRTRDASGASASSLESRPDPKRYPWTSASPSWRVSRAKGAGCSCGTCPDQQAPSAVIAYLMRSRGWRLVEAYRWVKSRREAVNLRPVAAAQLTRYEVAVFGHTANTSRDTNDRGRRGRRSGRRGGRRRRGNERRGGRGGVHFAGGHAGGFAFCQPVDGAPFVFGGGGGGPNGGWREGVRSERKMTRTERARARVRMSRTRRGLVGRARRVWVR